MSGGGSWMLLYALVFAASIAFSMALIKFAAFLMQRTRLGWLHALGFTVLTALLTAALLALGGDLLRTSMWMTMVMTAIIHLGAGSFYFGRFAATAGGERLGLQRGAALALLVALLSAGLSYLLVLAAPLLLNWLMAAVR